MFGKCPFAFQMQCNVFIMSKRKKDKEEKYILIKFATMGPVHSRVSRGKKITLSLTDKVKLLDFPPISWTF